MQLYSAEAPVFDWIKLKLVVAILFIDFFYKNLTSNLFLFWLLDWPSKLGGGME